ncbi:MAG: PIN domain-containing protein [Methanophagales archaeon]|nr:PIN domain-containing protein [Methanophagales archaeon]
MKLSLDANIFIYAYITGKKIKNERKRREWVQLHEKADVLYTDVLKGKHVVIIPSVIVAEVCAVISRLTNSEEEGISAAKEVQECCVVVYESASVLEELLPVIAKIKGSGIDSILAALAAKENTVLITNDRRLHDRLIASESYVDVRLLKDMSLDDIKMMTD